jgi:hypothetical protein
MSISLLNGDVPNYHAFPSSHEDEFVFPGPALRLQIGETVEDPVHLGTGEVQPLWVSVPSACYSPPQSRLSVDLIIFAPKVKVFRGRQVPLCAGIH